MYAFADARIGSGRSERPKTQPESVYFRHRYSARHLFSCFCTRFRTLFFPENDAEYAPSPPSALPGAFTGLPDTRPKRVAAAKPGDYVDKKQKRALFRHVANVYFALGMSKVAGACRVLGLDDTGADWEGVNYHVKQFKKKGTDKMFEQPEYRERALCAARQLECSLLPVPYSILVRSTG